MTTSNKVFSLFAFLGLVLSCIPFPRHLQAWNTGSCLIMAWNGVACVVYFVNSIIWDDNTNNSAPVWSDISSRVAFAAAIAVPTGVLCINRRLYLIITGKTITTQAERRRAVIFDLSLGLGIPAIDTILMYIPQNSRFIIYEDFGCFFSLSNTPVGDILATVPQLLIALVCAVYSVLTIRLILLKRRGLSEILHSNSNITTSGYLRLLIIAVVGSVVLVPLGLWFLVCGFNGVSRWPGWAATHANISSVQQVPGSIWRSNRIAQYNLEITRWEFVFSSALFFVCFGLHKEARASYKYAARRVIAFVFCLPPIGGPESTSEPKGGMPLVFAHSATSGSPKKFLGFSTNLTKVFADADGELSQTQKSFSYTISHSSLAHGGDGAQRSDPEAGHFTRNSVVSESQIVVATAI